MLKRVFFVLAAVLLAGLVLFITLRAEPSGTFGTQPSNTPLTPLSGNPVALERGQGAEPQRPVQAAREYRFVRINNRGQLIQVFGKEFRPLPQGVTEVEWPGARVHLTPHRVIEIRARKGTFVAPDSQPRNGAFHGRVVLTLYESSPDRRSPIDLSPTSPDVRLRLFMQDARFDLELGTIESQSDVHLTSPRFDFRGTGLSMSYNEGRSRIEHLEVPQGKALRIKTGATTPATRTAAGRNKPATQPEATTKPTNPPIFYVATFDKKVRVRGGDADVEGDHLRLIFSLVPAAGQDVLRGLSAGPEASWGRTAGMWATPAMLAMPGPGGMAARLLEMIPAQPLAVKPSEPRPAGPPATAPSATLSADAPLPLDETMTPVGPDDVNITWAGALTVEPIDAPPADLQGPDDAMIKIDGQPLRITTPRKEVVTSSTMDYLASNGRVRLLGVKEWPVTIDSRELGLLECESLVLDQVAGTGQILGPGRLRGHDEPPGAAGNAEAAPRREGSGLPRGMLVSWKKEVALGFFLRPPRNSASASSVTSGEVNRLRAMRSVDFRGDVDVKHPQFDLSSQELGLALGDPEKGRQSLDTITARGQVRVIGKGEADRGEIEVRSEDLKIGLARDAHGLVSPDTLQARGDVHARYGTQRLASGELDVSLGHLPPKGDAATRPADDKANRISVKTMQARQNVNIEMDDPKVRIAAERVDADAARDLFEIRGAEGRPARFMREDGTLVGDYIVVASGAQTVKVTGPGSFEFISATPLKLAVATQPGGPAGGAKPAAGEAATAKPAAAGPPNIVTVTWKELMEFDNRNGTARFAGSVECRSRFARETTRLTSEQLNLDFTPEGAAAAAAPAVGDPNNPLIRGGRAVKAVTARQDVRFLAQSWLDDQQKSLASRLSIDGPVLTFDNLTEQLQVPGAGHMLIEDYRPDAPSTQPATQAANPVGHFSGRGATLFTWAGRMTLDAFHNDMTLEQQVQMLHRPADGQAPVQVDCRRFTADLESTGGLGGWMSRNAPQPTIKTILADRDVRVLSGGRVIRTDRLEYNGADQTVTLKADPGHMSELVEPDQPAPFTAEEFAWDLKTGHIVVNKPGAGRVPVGK